MKLFDIAFVFFVMGFIALLYHAYLLDRENEANKQSPLRCKNASNQGYIVESYEEIENKDGFRVEILDHQSGQFFHYTYCHEFKGLQNDKAD